MEEVLRWPLAICAAKYGRYNYNIRSSVEHYPGLCMSVAILLKERNREMSGLQYIVSLLLYSSHVDKQVSDRNALMHVDNHK